MPQTGTDTKCSDFAQIYLWHITESAEELAQQISGGELLLEEASRMFSSPKRRLEWLATRALLQHTECKGVEILYHSNGAPHLAGSNKHISISHTQDYVAIAIADKPIGIDIEHITRNATRAIIGFLQPQEIEELKLHPTPAEETLRLWTAKEAAFKLAPDLATVLKDIVAQTTQASNNGQHTYRMEYKCGRSATCHTATTNGLVLSCCTF